mmetsp:Transcript_76786/g.206951  ORF Transcript_76786/g.206951 Transcript_76786/m.206951 type:complete len:97 (-) Transcript_76786:385-675(-)
MSSQGISEDLRHKKVVIESCRRKGGLSHWIALKYEQYQITSVLYSLDWWEQLIFNTLLISMFFATIFAMYVYIHASVPLFFLSIILFGKHPFVISC